MLLLDIGNTRIKWGLADGGRLDAVQAVAHEGDPVSALAALPATDAPVWLASVLDADLNAQVCAALQRRYPAGLHQPRAQAHCLGLRNAYDEPQRLGVDRWLAMVGLWHRLGDAFCVVSAGTALTFDAVDARGQHLGGLIAPGIRAMERATLGSTRFSTVVLPTPDRPLLADNTEACVAQGALHAALGLIERAVVDCGGVRFIAGGDGPLLLPHLPGQWSLCPNPVLEGLRVLGKPE